MAQKRRVEFQLTEEEYRLIEQKMQQLGTKNLSAYLRKMAIDGFVLKLDIPELKQMVSLLGKAGANINQIARRANENGRIYQTDLQDIQRQQQELIELARGIYFKLLAM